MTEDQPTFAHGVGWYVEAREAGAGMLGAVNEWFTTIRGGSSWAVFSIYFLFFVFVLFLFFCFLFFVFLFYFFPIFPQFFPNFLISSFVGTRARRSDSASCMSFVLRI